MQFNQLIHAKLLAESQDMANSFLNDSENFEQESKQPLLKTFILDNNPTGLAEILFTLFFGQNMDYENSIAVNLGIKLTKKGVIELFCLNQRYISALEIQDYDIDGCFSKLPS